MKPEVSSKKIINLLTEKLKDSAFHKMLEKDAPKAFADLGLTVQKEFPRSIKLDLSLPIATQIPWNLFEVKWYPYLPWRLLYWPWRYPWWPWYRKPWSRIPELPLYTSDCCCCCCHH